MGNRPPQSFSETLFVNATYPKKPNKKLPSKILSFGSEKLSKAKDLYFPYFYTLGNSLIFVLKLDFCSVWFFSIHSTLSMKKIWLLFYCQCKGFPSVHQYRQILVCINSLYHFPEADFGKAENFCWPRKKVYPTTPSTEKLGGKPSKQMRDRHYDDA